jgi:hypothetical protein
MIMSELLEALHKRGFAYLKFWRIEYLIRSGVLPPIRKDRKNRRIFDSSHLEAIIAVEARRAQG